MGKVKVGIIGTGNIGSDLLAKVMRSDILECGIFAGHNPESSGIKRAQEMGIPTTAESIHYIEEHPDWAHSEMQVKLFVSGLIASTLFVAMVVSRMVACMLPFLAKKIKLDPAVVCGPFTTTLVDVITLLTYFLLWTFLFGPMLGL